MNPNIILIGFTPGKHVSFICNAHGLAQLPEPLDYYTDGGGGMPIGGRIAMTQANMVTLRMLGLVNDNDLELMKPMGVKLWNTQLRHRKNCEILFGKRIRNLSAVARKNKMRTLQMCA